MAPKGQPYFGSTSAAGPLLAHHSRALSCPFACSPVFLTFPDLGGLRAQPTRSSTGPLSFVINGIQSNLSNNWKTRLQHCALYCWCFCGTLAIRSLQREALKGKKKRKRAQKKARKVLPWLQTSRHSHFVTCTICSSHAQVPITSFQMVINPLGPRHTCNLQLG